MKRFVIWIAMLVLICWSGRRASATVEKLGTYTGPGAMDGELIGPGPTPGSQRLYLAYMYVERTIDFVSVNPANGKWRSFANPLRSEYGAIMALGPDGNIYLGTRPHAHLYQFNPITQSYRDLGQPVAGEAYIYGLATGIDGKLYGCTYPSATLFRYDTKSGKVEDLGRMDPKEEYAKSIAASDDGFVYVGIGSSQAHLAAYRIATGQHRDILPSSVSSAVDKDGEGSTAVVRKGSDGKIYASVGNRYFLVKDWTVREIPAREVKPSAPTTRLKNGDVVTVQAGQLLIHAPESLTGKWVPYTYPGREGTVFRIAIGSDGRVYGSSILPFHLFAIDTSKRHMTDLGRFGVGEAYSLTSWNGKLYVAIYDGNNGVPLMVFHPGQNIAPGSSLNPNPLYVTYDGSDPGWRPMAMVMGPGGKFYIGSVAGYGRVSGPLTILDPATNGVQKFPDVIPGQSVVSLAALSNQIVGGTTIYGGGGSHPTQTDAKLFIWDPAHNKKIYETVPVPGASSITDLLALPGGKVLGITTGRKSGSSMLFAVDPRSRRLDYTIPFGLKGVIYNSVALGPDHAVWGLVQEGIFRFDTKTRRLQLMEKTPEPVTAGFALSNNSIYYASGPAVFRYGIP